MLPSRPSFVLTCSPGAAAAAPDELERETPDQAPAAAPVQEQSKPGVVVEPPSPVVRPGELGVVASSQAVLIPGAAVLIVGAVVALAWWRAARNRA